MVSETDLKHKNRQGMAEAIRNALKERMEGQTVKRPFSRSPSAASDKSKSKKSRSSSNSSMGEMSINDRQSDSSKDKQVLVTPPRRDEERFLADNKSDYSGFQSDNSDSKDRSMRKSIKKAGASTFLETTVNLAMKTDSEVDTISVSVKDRIRKAHFC